MTRHVVNQLLKIYATDNVAMGAAEPRLHMKPSVNMTSSLFKGKPHVKKALYRLVFNDFVLMERKYPNYTVQQTKHS